jgi:triphosphatase
VTPPAPVEVSAPNDTPQPISLGEVAHGVVSTQLSALLAHEASARAGEDPEGVHQMRVATRRLRAGLKMFGEVLPAPEAELRSELGWLADHLGAVRDVDVQLASLTKVAAGLRPDAEAMAPVLNAFEARRSSARAELVEALDGPRYAALVAALSAVVAQAPGSWPGRATLPAEETLPELIRKRYRRYRKATRDAHATSPSDELHRARIRAKQLRYSLEFVSDVYGKPARSLSKRIVNVQDVFGAIQDAAVMDQRLRGLGQPGHELPPSSMFVLGQLAQCYAQEAKLNRDEIARALDGVSRARWRRLRRHFVKTSAA